MARRRARPPAEHEEDPEAIALRLRQIASVAGVIADGEVDERRSNALYLLEASLLDVEQRVERLRRM